MSLSANSVRTEKSCENKIEVTTGVKLQNVSVARENAGQRKCRWV